MIRILLINPNTSQATTEMMVRIAQAAAPADMQVIGTTARNGVPMILDADTLANAGREVVALGQNNSRNIQGVIVAGFGDPGVADLRQVLSIPIVGLAESAMREATDTGLRFGVATVTPKLVKAIDAKATELGLTPLYTGVRLAPGEPMALAADPERVAAALAVAVSRCIEEDEAEAVVIGGGPLGVAAEALALRFAIPIIAPIPAAMRRLMNQLALPAG